MNLEKPIVLLQSKFYDMDKKVRLMEFHQLLCDALNKEGIKDEWKGQMFDWEPDKEDPYNTFLGGICHNDRAFEFLSKKGYLYKRICPECGEFPIENRFTFRIDDKIFYICKNCYQNGIESNPLIVKNKSGCYIATACYKDPDCNEIAILKSFRDGILSKTKIGRLLIRLYYYLSPSIARWLSNKKWMNDFVRYQLLDKIVKKLIKKYPSK